MLAMNFSDYLQFLQPIQEQLNKFYSIASLAITVLVALWLFKFVAGLIQTIFSMGKAFGGLYRNYFHKYLRSSMLRLGGFFMTKRSVDSNTN